METPLISDNAKEIDALNSAVIGLIRQTYGYMTRSDRLLVYDILLNGIRDIHFVLTNFQVRGNLDERLHTPDVTQNSSWRPFFRRLQNLATCACILADSVHSDPEEESVELTALYRVKFVLRLMLSKVSLVRELLDFCYDF
ncbi:unnamed protein product [Caenorhabditis angaria]|uniref:Uncharacterized protein n=2 Tax=Caenorhabditis angaria TaxID=860376 RepID=A0A9P1IKL5_9PELO|nr:unnamed protein product [Caenorhabditis angaria]